MSDPRPPESPEPDDEHGEDSTTPPQGPTDPFAALFQQLGLNLPGGAGMPDLNALMRQFGQMGSSGGIGFQPPGHTGSGAAGSGGAPAADDWSWLKNMVRQMSAQSGPDPSPTPSQQRRLQDTTRVAELWLDEVTDFPAVTSTPQVWSRAEWIEATFSGWQPVAEPVIKALAAAMGEVPNEGEEPADDPLAMITSMLAPFMENISRQMYGAQFGQALAELSSAVVSGSDFGFQLAKTPRVALLVNNIDKHFGELDVSEDDVWLYLTLREAARQRLFHQVAWLGPQLQALVEHYARETRIDLSAMGDSLGLGDPTQLNPEELQGVAEKLQGKIFEPEPTEEQREILSRLHTLLALVEGWVDHLVALVAGKWMPTQAALSEAVRRRRGAGGPTENAFKSLVGLELKPRRVRDAANLWAALTQARGASGRDALWSHPDLLPTAADLDDPLGFADPDATPAEPADEWDRGLEQLLREERPDQP